MMDFLRTGGIAMWPLAAVTLGILYMTVRSGLLLRRGETPAEEIRRNLLGILFWGAMAMVLGFLGTVMGIVMMAEAAQLAGPVEPTLIWGGVHVALTTLLVGSFIFIVATLIWFALRSWHHLVLARSEE